MIKFQFYLKEAASEEKLKHLEHAEDHVINSGFDGFAHAYHNLQDVHDQLSGKKSKTKITTKYDGSPSIVFGHHPETGKFFVASKSAFNKDPKINHTEEDIDRNHGHAPGLAEKLKIALKHLPKVSPKTGVYQGDVMHSGIKSKTNPGGDVTQDHFQAGSKYHFQANPSGIKYSTNTNSTEGKKIATSKFGVAVHTAYSGDTIGGLKAEYGIDTSKFKAHPDVHVIDVTDDAKHANMTPDQHATFKKHLDTATKAFKEAPKSAYKALEGHKEHLKTYINKTVREGTTPNVEGYTEHVKEIHAKGIAGVKTAKAITTKTEKMQGDLAHIDKHKENFNKIFDMHHHLQAAKDQLVKALSAKPKFESSMKGNPTKPEGYVAIRDNRPTKLVDRAEFSRMNFLR